jgi:hypothetical protein
VLSNTEILSKCTLARVGEGSQWTITVNSAEENRAKFCNFLDGKLLFSTLHGMYMVTLKELNTILKVKAQARQSEAVNKTSLNSTAQDDHFQEVKRCKRYL